MNFIEVRTRNGMVLINTNHISTIHDGTITMMDGSMIFTLHSYDDLITELFGKEE